MTATANRAGLLKRLRAVETLAERGSTEGERSAARRRAERMRERHSITDAELSGSRPRAEGSTPSSTAWWEPFRGHPAWTAYYEPGPSFDDRGWPGFFGSTSPRPQPSWAPPVDDQVRLLCTCGHVTLRTVLRPGLTTIMAYRCEGCQSQRRASHNDFAVTRPL